MYNIDLTLYTKNDVIKIRYIDKLPHCKLTPLVKDKIDKWISDLRNNTNEKLVIMLIGNKIDLDKERTVKSEEGQEKSNENEVAYIETSALDSRNVEKAFESIVTKIHKTYINDNIKDMQTQSHQLQKGKNITDNSNTNEHSSLTNKIEHLKCC